MQNNNPQTKRWHAEYKLHLYPVKSHPLPPPPFFTNLLNKLEFIGHQISTENPPRYKVGAKFLSQVTFMGCSPDIELELQDNSPYCYIEIEQCKKPQLITGKNLKPAKCPHCKSPITQFDTEDRYEDNCKTHCKACHQAIDYQTLNWRKTAFYASSWITIGNIYELEAIPNDSLLTALEKQTGSAWKAAYIRHVSDKPQDEQA